MSGFRPFPSSNRLRHGGQRLDDREREPMPPSTPEQRFEVPPEYAEVYERAEKGGIRLDTQRDEPIVNTVFIPVKD